MPPKVAYIMSRFPHLPETFILREMIELERQGWQVALYPLMRQQQPVIHPAAVPWIPRARDLALGSPGLWAANGRAWAQRPLRLGRLWGRMVRENLRCPNYLVRSVVLFPKAVAAARLMQQEGVVHIHAHYASHPALVAWVIHHLTGISYSMTAHAHDIFVRTAMLPTKLRDAAFVVAISEHNRDYLARVAGEWVRAKTHVVHCGVVPGDYPARPRLPAGGEPLEIVNVGSLQPYKGQRYLVEACGILRQRRIPFHCRIVGGGELRPALEQSIRELQLQGAVELLGPQPQDEVSRILAGAHAYVQPSIITASGKMEGIPVSLMEAMASGLPVIATAISGMPELVRPAQTGWLVPPADAAALADALAALVADPASSSQLAAAGRELVVREFNLETNVAALTSLFQASLSRRQTDLAPVAGPSPDPANQPALIQG